LKSALVAWRLVAFDYNPVAAGGVNVVGQHAARFVGRVLVGHDFAPIGGAPVVDSHARVDVRRRKATGVHHNASRVEGQIQEIDVCGDTRQRSRKSEESVE
jgi:hypothetical protein